MKFWKYTFALLALIIIVVFLAVFSFDSNLHLIACDVGQGDAVLATLGKTQILIDGGPGKQVIECLSKYVPFWDREIEMVVLTHPQKDHYGGLIEVFRRYKVDYFLVNELDSSDQGYQVLEDLVGGSGTRLINPVGGMIIGNSLMYLDILYPSKRVLAENLEVSKSQNSLGKYTSKLDSNEFSIVAILKFGDFSALLTGDMTPKTSDEIIAEGQIVDVDYLKVPHHGSKNGLTKELLDLSKPEIAVISVGKGNIYKHPHKETLDILNKENIQLFRTDLNGDIEIVTNGESWWEKKWGLEAF